MKLNYGRGKNRVFDVDIKTDYFLDNGACIQLVSMDKEKHKFVGWHFVRSWIFPKAKFQKLLKNDFVKKMKIQNENEPTLIYYCFTEKVNTYEEVFK